MKMSKFSTALMTAGLMAAGVSVHAEEAKSAVTVSGSAAFTTDYLFRGVSQTSNNAAVQAAMTFSHESGAYFTAWGSSVSGANLGGGIELDTLLGYAGKVGEVGYDVGVMRYNYPGFSAETYLPGSAVVAGFDPDYDEAYASVSFKGAKLGVAFSPDYYFESGEFTYAFLDYSVTVADIGLLAHVGMNSFEDAAMMTKALALSATNTDDSYMDYKVAVSKTVGGVGLELAYIGADIDEAECGGGLCEGRAVGTISKAF